VDEYLPEPPLIVLSARRPIGSEAIGAVKLLLWPTASILIAGIASAAMPPPEVKKIDEACAAAAKLDARHKAGLRVLADLSDAVRPEANDRRGKWVLFSSAEERMRYARENGAPNTQAQTWSAPDGTVIASLYFQSDSGDWADDVEYCFRGDGSLVRSKAIVINYADEIDGERLVYYAAGGRELFSMARSLDERRKPRADMHGLDVPPVYPTIKSLPFNQRADQRADGSPSVPASVPIASTRDVPLAADGFLDPAAVNKQVLARLGRIRHCYEQELATDRSLSGKIVVHWTIDLDGTTANVSIENATVQMGKVAACVVDRVKRWRFVPAPKEGRVEMSFPFVFQPSDGMRPNRPPVSDLPAR
jgi:TonB family protein